MIVHTSATAEEVRWLMRWAEGEPPFGPGYGRDGDVNRFFEWRRVQLRLRSLGI